MPKFKTAGRLITLMLLISACQSTHVAIPASAIPSTPLDALTSFQNKPTPTAVSEDVINAADAEYLVLENIYDRVTPSVVYIDVTINQPQAGTTDEASGSGFIYDDQGHIITNAHVVNGASTIQVTFHDGYTVPATVVGIDAYSDMAVIKVENVDKSRLLPVTFGDSDQLHVGERVIAIGNPFGLASSMTTGIVSGLGRQLPSAQLVNNSGSGFNNPSIIQVDAQINPGNSGGPLLDSHGTVIGVNTAIRTDTGIFQGVGFAVPSKTVERVIPQLIQSGKAEYSWLGIATTPSGMALAGLSDQLKLPVTSGVLVTGITANSPAALAGLRGGDHAVLVSGLNICAGGDIIVAVNDLYITSMDNLVAYLVNNTKPGDVVKLMVVRGTDTFEIPLTLQARPDDAAAPPACGQS